jgi:CheY-like chemotaxis protein
MIFIVDDDASVRTSLTRLLRSAGHQVLAFPSAEACLDELHAAGAAIGCVILDVQMPGMTSLELQQAINRRKPPLPVIILTATEDADLRKMGLAVGVVKLLRKPCDSAALLGAVAEAIGRLPPTLPSSQPFATPTTPATPTTSPTCGSACRPPANVDADPDRFTVEARRGLYRPVGVVEFDEVVALVRAAIAAACRHRLRDLLVDTTALSGFPSPDAFERFLAAVEWAEEARAGVRMAMVAAAEMIDPHRFGVLIATTRGLVSNIFTTEAQARAWLDARADQ